MKDAQRHTSEEDAGKPRAAMACKSDQVCFSFLCHTNNPLGNRARLDDRFSFDLLGLQNRLDFGEVLLCRSLHRFQLIDVGLRRLDRGSSRRGSYRWAEGRRLDNVNENKLPQLDPGKLLHVRQDPDPSKHFFVMLRASEDWTCEWLRENWRQVFQIENGAEN